MFQKQCPTCGDSFSHKDRRQRFCSKDCYLAREPKTDMPLAAKLPTPTPIFKSDQKLDLPDPDQLPAPYAKRVYDMWKTLIGEAPPVIRIA